MDRELTISILRELLAAEQRSLVPRLLESTMFVSRAAIENQRVIERLARSCNSACQRLTEMILSLGGSPSPRAGDLHSAGIHFQELHHILPQLIADREQLVRKYEIASTRIVAAPTVSELLRLMLDNHRQELDSLRLLLGNAPVRKAG
jgi:hypothetical protein